MKIPFLKKSTVYVLLLCLLNSFVTLDVLDPVSIGNFPEKPRIDSNNAYLYVPNVDSDSVSVIDIQDPFNATVVFTIAGLDSPRTPAIDSNNEFLYIPNRGSNIISVYNIVDPTAPVFVQDVTVENSPEAPVIDSNDEFLYVSNNGSDSVSKIKLDGLTVVINIPVGDAPLTPVIDSNNEFLYVSNSFDGSVTKINLSTEATSLIYGPVGGQLVEVPLIDSNNEFLYVPGDGPNEIIRIDLSGGPLAQIPIGSAPKTPAIDTSNSYLYVSDTGNSVSVVRLSDNTIINTLTVGGGGSNPMTPLFDDVNQQLFVTTTNQNIFLTFDVSDPEGLVNFLTYPTNGTGSTPVIDSNSGFLYVSIEDAPGFVDIYGLSGADPDDSLAPPTNLQGTRIKDRFALQTDNINRIVWNPSTSATVTYYSVYRNGSFIGCASSTAPFFDDHNRRPGQTYTYTVISGSQTGFSEPATLVF